MRAIIDLGTNTFHLLVAEVSNGGIKEYFKLQVSVNIGQGGINEGFISDDAFERGMTALSAFRKYLDEFEVKDVKAFATSAIRNATNGEAFINAARTTYKIKVEAISGEAEAIFIYEGVKHSFRLPSERILVMDIGGGSVELIIGQQEKILWKQSFELGAARLIDLFHHTDPVTEKEMEAIISYFKEQLEPLKKALEDFPVHFMVGSAGSFETLVDVVLKDLKVIPNVLSKHAFEIRREDFDVFFELMTTSTINQRKLLKGMVDFRVEMIVVSALLMRYVLDESGARRLIASDYSLKEGILFAG